jgi:glycosyltransferase involved in cell wall biosynthesis
MCAARPVVASRVGGTPEVLHDGEHGILITPQRPAELASAIEKLLAHPLASHMMGLRGRQHVERDFSLDRMRAATESLYAQLIDGATIRRLRLIPAS